MAIGFVPMSGARERVGAPDAKVYYNIGVSLYNLRKENPAHIDDALAAYYPKMS